MGHGRAGLGAREGWVGADFGKSPDVDGSRGSHCWKKTRVGIDTDRPTLFSMKKGEGRVGWVTQRFMGGAGRGFAALVGARWGSEIRFPA